jgi:ABC-type branched-subunit amino acid transport system permease subunit
VSGGKLTAFALSAALAAVSGALIGYQSGRIAFPRYDVFQSILLVGALYVASVGSVIGAVVAGAMVSGGLLFTLLSDVGAPDAWQGIIIGALVLATVTIAPDGIVVETTRWLRRAARRREPPGSGASVEQPAAA